jgi:F-type H+-transporting ATPase subunit b
MLIDWFTVGAQALNFLILVWLMKRFLYKPILHAIDEREKRIAKELANADAKKAEAQKEHDEFKHKNEEFDQQRAALLSKATDEAKAERQRLLDEARKAADALSANAGNAEKRRTELTSSNQPPDPAGSICHRAKGADGSRHDEFGRTPGRGVHSPLARDGRPGERRPRRGLKTASDPAVVRSAFDLPAEQRAAIQNALNETFSAEIHVRFETAPDLISGIELTTNGQKVAWSIADYLASLEKGVDELLKEKDKPEAKAGQSLKSKPEVRRSRLKSLKPRDQRTKAIRQVRTGVKTSFEKS